MGMPNVFKPCAVSYSILTVQLYVQKAIFVYSAVEFVAIFIDFISISPLNKTISLTKHIKVNMYISLATIYSSKEILHH